MDKKLTTNCCRLPFRTVFLCECGFNLHLLSTTFSQL